MRKKICLAIMLQIVMVIALTGCSKEKTTTEAEATVAEVEVGESEVTIEEQSSTEDLTASEDQSEYFSMKVDGVYSFTEGVLATGTIESGTVKANDQVEIANEGNVIVATVIRVEIHGEVVDSATKDDYVGIMLKDLKRSDVAVDGYITTPGQGTLDALAAEEEANAAVLHPPIDSMDRDFRYEINIEKGEYIETKFCTIEDIELVIGNEFGNNKITVEEPKYESSQLGGMKAKLTNTSDETYCPGNCSTTVWSYDTKSYTPGGPHDGILYVEKDGDLLENVEVAPGETVVIYILGEIDYGWHQRYADELYVVLYMRESFVDDENCDSEYSFEIRDFDR